jgi:hypothetical protein
MSEVRALLLKTHAPETALLLTLVTLHQQFNPYPHDAGLPSPPFELVLKHEAVPSTVYFSSVLCVVHVSPQPPPQLAAAAFASESSLTHNPTAAFARLTNKRMLANIINPASFIFIPFCYRCLWREIKTANGNWRSGIVKIIKRMTPRLLANLFYNHGYPTIWSGDNGTKAPLCKWITMPSHRV